MYKRKKGKRKEKFMEIQSKAGEYEDISKEGKKNFFNFDE
jgi:hypothetical protein